jgi:alkanesulfonate monooxygenase SsuD/methylene tetrahydromethanopterin reductase-like flavin-dependent oxidoreductase (luciferase family)
LLDAWRDHDRDGTPEIALARPVHVGEDRGEDRPLVGPPESIRRDLRAYADAGVTHVALMFYTLDVDDQLGQIERFATEVAPRR